MARTKSTARGGKGRDRPGLVPSNSMHAARVKPPDTDVRPLFCCNEPSQLSLGNIVRIRTKIHELIQTCMIRNHLSSSTVLSLSPGVARNISRS
jgi:hypothetical protein